MGVRMGGRGMEGGREEGRGDGGWEGGRKGRKELNIQVVVALRGRTSSTFPGVY